MNRQLSRWLATAAPAVVLACSCITVRSSVASISNIAPLSNLRSEIPGYVDGVLNATGSGCGGGGGPCLSAAGNNRITIAFSKLYAISRLVFYVGCNDGNRMDGSIYDVQRGGSLPLADFHSIGCGESVSISETLTNRIAIVMTGGGGDDFSISIEEIEVYGWS